MTTKAPLGNLFGRSAVAHSPFQNAVDAARLARAGEQYAVAEAALDQAEALAASEVQRMTVNQLRAETLIEAGKLEEAEAVIARLREGALGAPRVYALIAAALLAQARGELDSAHALLEDAQEVGRANSLPSPEGRAACHLGDVYLAEGNPSYAVHVLRDNLTRLSGPLDVDWSPWFVGRMGQALLASGGEVEGHQLVARGLELAEQAHNRRCQRVWALLLGELAVADRRYSDAQPRLEQALALMDNRPPAERAHARRLLALTHLALRSDDAAQEQAAAALADAKAAGDAALIRRAQGTLGMVLRAAGRTEEALPHLRAGAAEDGAPEVRRVLAAALMAAHDEDGARALFEAAAHAAPDGSLEMAEARRDLGVHYFQRHMYNEAIASWVPAASLFEVHQDYASAARLHADLAGARKGLGQPTRAFKDIDQALTLLSHVPASDDDTRGVVLANAASAYAEQGDIETADSFFNDSVVMAQRVGDRASESLRSGNYGWFLTLIGRPRRAMANLEHALRISAELGLRLPQAVQTDNLALAYDGAGEYPTALRYHREALLILGELDEPYWKASVQINLAATLTALNEPAEADVLLAEALDWARAQPFTELTVRGLTALSALRLHESRPAEAPIEEAVSLARHHELRRLLADALTVQSQRDAALVNAAAARAAWDEALRLYTVLKMPQARLQPAWLK